MRNPWVFGYALFVYIFLILGDWYLGHGWRIFSVFNFVSCFGVAALFYWLYTEKNEVVQDELSVPIEREEV